MEQEQAGRVDRKLHEQMRKLSDERAQLYSKKKLMNTITKKLKTTMIGAVAACEEHLGFLWGHGKPVEELTEAEIKFRDEIWEELRTAILNKGNSQLRAAMEEIAHYSLRFERYRTDFIVSKEKPGDDNE